MKAGELLGVILDQEREHAAEAAERLIPVPGDRPPGLLAAFLEADPAPLIEVAVPVSDQDVDEPRTKVIPRIDFLAGAFVQPDEEVEGVRNLPASGNAALHPLFEESQHAGKRGTELAEPRIVRHHGKLRRGMEYAGGLEQRRDHQRAARMQGAGQVLDDVADGRFPRLGIEVPGCVLVHRAKVPDPSVPALEVEALRLLAPAAALRAEPAVERIQIQHRYLDRRGPKLAPLPAKEEPGEPARLVPRPGRERLGPSRVPDDFL